uniref:Uncharacterized protein n=1 Tax=Rhizophora mucronata TaxID=61149 RepID=A0A2P2IPY1_RHIMU
MHAADKSVPIRVCTWVCKFCMPESIQYKVLEMSK